MPAVVWRPGEPLYCSLCVRTCRRALLVADEFAASLAARPGVVKEQTRWSRVRGTRPHGSMSVPPSMAKEAMSRADSLFAPLAEGTSLRSR
jgi:hypothetical protein